MLSPLPAIGVVRTARTELEHTPVQAAANRAEEGTIELDERFAEGLAGLAAFDYAWLLSWLDRPDRPAGELTQVPYLLRREGRRMGIFATRGPRRPNPIGRAWSGCSTSPAPRSGSPGSTCWTARRCWT